MFSSDSLDQYLHNIRQASDINLKWLICKKNREEQWQVSLPSVSGFYSEKYWIVNPELDDYGKVKLAIPIELGNRHKNLIVQVPDSIEFLQETECELVAVREVL